MNVFEEMEILTEGLFNKKPISMKEALPKIKENIKKIKNEKDYKFVNSTYIKNAEPDTYKYYASKGFTVTVEGVTCFVKGSKEDVKSITIYALTNNDVLTPMKVKFK